MKSPGQSVPALLMPTGCGSMVVPSALVCEVVARTRLFPLPGMQDWVLGYFIWRGVPVCVVSFERLLGKAGAAGDIRKLVVLYPLPGRGRNDYFAIATNAEPRTTNIGVDTQVAASAILPQRYVLSMLELQQGTGFIPDLQALKSTFYPG